MGIACRICILTKGLQGSKISTLFQSEGELFDHLEKVHHMPVRRENETTEGAAKRFLEKYPEARTCPECIARGAPWAK